MLRVTKKLARGVLLFALSLVYWVSVGMFAVGGVFVTLIGIGVLGGHDLDPFTLSFGVLD